ncbi:MAG: hypothetical protein OXH90_09920 [Paracoccaceae bacterium]|nr:hypothetical protein [Paracoccaceae bacterium]MDE2917673.1 hypothetical protein [Paracoccaceae bacterium]
MKLLSSILLGFLGAIAGLIFAAIIALIIIIPNSPDNSIDNLIALLPLTFMIVGAIIGAIFPYRKSKKKEDIITERQELFLIDLCDENLELAHKLDLDDAKIAELSKSEASQIIEMFLAERK